MRGGVLRRAECVGCGAGGGWAAAAAEHPIYEPALLEERDRYMAGRLKALAMGDRAVAPAFVRVGQEDGGEGHAHANTNTLQPIVVFHVISVDARTTKSYHDASLNTAWLGVCVCVCVCVRGMVLRYGAAEDGLRFMRYRAEPQAPAKPPTRVLAVVGLAHVAGICAEWDKK
jgi:pheromone shutdown protein TraB